MAKIGRPTIFQNKKPKRIQTIALSATGIHLLEAARGAASQTGEVAGESLR